MSRLRACSATWAAACHVTEGQWAAAHSPVSPMFAAPPATPAPTSHAIQSLPPVSLGTRGGTGAVQWPLVSDRGAAGAWAVSSAEGDEDDE